MLAVAGVIVLAAVVGYYVLANSPFALRLGIVLLGLVVAAGIGWASQPGKDFFQYCQDSTAETKKVVWPSRKETLQTTAIVVAFVLVMAIFLWVVDASLVWLVRMLVGREA
jgi:preprotein translocase subunit SecE